MKLICYFFICYFALLVLKNKNNHKLNVVNQDTPNDYIILTLIYLKLECPSVWKSDIGETEILN